MNFQAGMWGRSLRFWDLLLLSREFLRPCTFSPSFYIHKLFLIILCLFSWLPCTKNPSSPENLIKRLDDNFRIMSKKKNRGWLLHLTRSGKSSRNPKHRSPSPDQAPSSRYCTPNSPPLLLQCGVTCSGRWHTGCVRYARVLGLFLHHPPLSSEAGNSTFIMGF